VGVLVVYALLPASINVLLLGIPSLGPFPDQLSVNGFVVGKVIGLAIVALAITALHWWPDVLREQLRVRAWVWVVPAVMLAESLIFTDWTRLGQAGAAIALSLLAGCLILAIGEELAFRGMVLRFARDRWSEPSAAIVTTVLFGVFHLVGGPLYAFAALLGGWLYYYIRRVSGGILLPILVHALFDFAVFSSQTTATVSTDSNASPVQFLTSVVLVIALVIFRKRAEPASAEDRH
jgi:membrane protease YdiL (CAAX protease family)